MAQTPTLRIEQRSAGENQYAIRVEFTAEGFAPQKAEHTFAFQLTEQDQKDFRWYFEDYLQFPLDPAPTIAARIEARLDEIGIDLFNHVFKTSEAARDLWARLRDCLGETRIEIETTVEGATAVPWELMRDSRTDVPLALRARAFARVQPAIPEQVKLPDGQAEKVHILLVICRPGRGEDVPFRSVASRLLKSLDEAARETFELEVLRPATYDRLAQALREAHSAGRPYHIVHFDGHGMYIDLNEASQYSELSRRLSPLMLGGERRGPHGYLLFEDPQSEDNMRLVDGSTLGKLLAETHVPILVLNACQSAYAEPEKRPGDAAAQPEEDKVRAFGSLAQEVMNHGRASVVAMRYTVYVEAAKKFVGDLYAWLAKGRTLGAAVTLARKALADNPNRSIGYAPLAHQDWSVPVVYEAAPVCLFQPRAAPLGDGPIHLDLSAGAAAPEREGQFVNLPHKPDIGFFGRDETLLALDRAFDTERIVLLHGWAGHGKTTTAAEFARWYALTGGVRGPVLFTSFEDPQPLERVLDIIPMAFKSRVPNLERVWGAASENERRSITLDILSKSPVLWIWDNTETVAGFPAAKDAKLIAEQQQVLTDFLRDARVTQAKFLLTSRRDERSWLGEHLPQRIKVPNMPMQERVQLASALSEKYRGEGLKNVENWRPLLEFTQGNPLTILVVVGQAIRDGLSKSGEIEDYVRKLRAGESVFADEEEQGRTKSLAVSLRYGFSGFSEDERRILGLLHLFQGTVILPMLQVMGTEKADWGLAELRGRTPEALTALLDRAAAIGVLNKHNDLSYGIHPALPWFFKQSFEQFYPSMFGEGELQDKRLKALRAYVEAVAGLASTCGNDVQRGNNNALRSLRIEEGNMLNARSLALDNGWWNASISCMYGLNILYRHIGQKSLWTRLVEDILPYFVDLTSGAPLPDVEREGDTIINYLVQIMIEQRRWPEAERLQRQRIQTLQTGAKDLLAVSPEELSSKQKTQLANLGGGMRDMGAILEAQSNPECVSYFKQAYELNVRAGENSRAASFALNVGNAYKDVPSIRDLDQAEAWYQVAINMSGSDANMLGQSYGSLGNLAYARFLDARKARADPKELAQHFDAALLFYNEALRALPSDELASRAMAHNNLGSLWLETPQTEQALHHFDRAIYYFQKCDDHFSMARTQFNVALVLARQDSSLGHALAYAQAAQRNYEQYGAGAITEIDRMKRLVNMIEEELKKLKAAPA